LDETQYVAFSIGEAPYNYVEDMPHDGWRLHLPYLIDTYKHLQPTIGTESLVAWYRRSPGTACGDGGTTGNTASQLQIESEPSVILRDRVYFTALLSSPATLLTPEGLEIEEWDYTPVDGVGLYHLSLDMEAMGVIGEAGVRASLQRRGDVGPFIEMESTAGISTSCQDDITNWNAYVLSGSAQDPSSAQAPNLADQVCVSGTGADEGNFRELCEFTCKYGYVSANPVPSTIIRL
jgi:hypothetical protein